MSEDSGGLIDRALRKLGIKKEPPIPPTAPTVPSRPLFSEGVSKQIIEEAGMPEEPTPPAPIEPSKDQPDPLP